MEIIYSNRIKEVGNRIAELDKVLILFGDSVPDNLREYCYIIELSSIKEEIKAGQKAIIGGKEYNITAVGDGVMKNLESLGHVTFSFTGETEAILPDTIYLEEAKAPKLEVKSIIQIII